MTEVWDNIPQFWKGVLSSIVAAIICGIAVYLFRVFFRQGTDWFRTKNENRQRQIDQLRIHLNSTKATERMEAYLFFTFNTLKYLFLGNILWVLPEAVDAIGWSQPLYFLKAASLYCFFLGLRWVYFYYELRPSSPYALSPSSTEQFDDELFKQLSNSRWQFPDEKVLTLREDGSVHKSWGRLTPPWNIQGGRLHYEEKVFEFTDNYSRIIEVTKKEFSGEGKRISS